MTMDFGKRSCPRGPRRFPECVPVKASSMAPRNIWRVTGGGAYFLRQKLPHLLSPCGDYCP
ncbi:hypothetical protein CY34DRAFT_814423 [Suillus luteus UH-Slu-Lm8-n1]|uniref:Uncharacterized protein n=1 Tax=Suillus luteus UH-Slu-Lm8-n1 TaxID=930992 RepID=A0A0C9Z421_9AGAM|nr:hypothetical protein CY34DRAFT_814423 [Suillus luteus UH-Slu-Lm8-n1]